MNAITVSVISGVIGNLLSHIGIKAGGKAGELLLTTTHDSFSSTGIVVDVDYAMIPSDADAGETPRFLARQRRYHRIGLARTKWEWLVLATYYHQTHGFPARYLRDWHPRAIAGQYTTAHFAGDELPHETYLGEASPPDIRTKILHGRIQVANTLAEMIHFIEAELLVEAARFSFPPSLWPAIAETKPAWVALMIELSDHNFPDERDFNSYCGFKNLWSVRDTPAVGITPRGNSTPNIHAYAAVMELAWHLAKEGRPLHTLYEDNVTLNYKTPPSPDFTSTPNTLTFS